MPQALMISALALAPLVVAQGRSTPDFGPNVTVLDPSMSVQDINARLRSLATRSTGFDEVRNAVLFMPGSYGSAAGQDTPTTATGIIDAPVGFMETVQGLGADPGGVTINGNLRAGAAGRVALDTFWRSLSNVRINPIEADEAPHTLRWNTSQACPLRRVDITGNLDLAGGVAGGNLIANSRIAGVVTAGSNWVSDSNPLPGQYYYDFHDSRIGGWQGHWVNYVFSGVLGAPQTRFNPGDVTTLPTTPVSREPPFLYVDHGRFKVFVPDARTEVSGFHWGTSTHGQGGATDRSSTAARDGVSLSMDRFLIARPTDSTATLNRALQAGRNLLLTPGVYKLTRALHVVRPDTIIMGMGLATVTPINGTAAIQVDDVAGVLISALTLDANTIRSDVLLQVGKPHSHPRHPSLNDPRGRNPTTLSDVFVRVGGSYAGRTTTSFEINQNHVLIDHTWLWRADHGTKGTVGWYVNPGEHGLVVNGDHVTALGLFVEHYRQTQIQWNGNAGRTIFLQSEAPYDPPDQAAYMNGTENGYPFYQVGPNVTLHEATGLTAVTLFIRSSKPITIHSAYRAPELPEVRFRDIFAGVLLAQGGIEHVINESAASALTATAAPSFVRRVAVATQLTSYP
jgi:hypothetical protein